VKDLFGVMAGAQSSVDLLPPVTAIPRGVRPHGCPALFVVPIVRATWKSVCCSEDISREVRIVQFLFHLSLWLSYSSLHRNRLTAVHKLYPVTDGQLDSHEETVKAQGHVRPQATSLPHGIFDNEMADRPFNLTASA
jgi:hypothetical protein